MPVKCQSRNILSPGRWFIIASPVQRATTLGACLDQSLTRSDQFCPATQLFLRVYVLLTDRGCVPANMV